MAGKRPPEGRQWAEFIRLECPNRTYPEGIKKRSALSGAVDGI